MSEPSSLGPSHQPNTSWLPAPGQMPPQQAPQYQMPPGQMPQQMPPPGTVPQPGMPVGQLVINARPAFGSPLTFTGKVCFIDGYQVHIRNGTNAMFISAGQHHVQIYSSYMRRYGRADIDVYVPPNGVTQIYYSEPVSQFHATGNVGFVPQPTGGKGSIWLLVGLLIASSVIAVIFGVLSEKFGLSISVR